MTEIAFRIQGARPVDSTKPSSTFPEGRECRYCNRPLSIYNPNDFDSSCALLEADLLHTSREGDVRTPGAKKRAHRPKHGSPADVESGCGCPLARSRRFRQEMGVA